MPALIHALFELFFCLSSFLGIDISILPHLPIITLALPQHALTAALCQLSAQMKMMIHHIFQMDLMECYTQQKQDTMLKVSQ